MTQEYCTRSPSRRRSPPRFMQGRSVCTAMALFTGAIAGGCVGLHGIVGMGLGIAAGITPMILFRRLRRG